MVLDFRFGHWKGLNREGGKGQFRVKVAFSSLLVRALPVPETKIEVNFPIQIYPKLVGKMASETTFDHWKVVFLMRKARSSGQVPTNLGHVSLEKWSFVSSTGSARTESEEKATFTY